MGSNSSKGVGVVETAAAPALKAADTASAAGGGDKPKCKACCACPETKRARDQWLVNDADDATCFGFFSY